MVGIHNNGFYPVRVLLEIRSEIRLSAVEGFVCSIQAVHGDYMSRL